MRSALLEPGELGMPVPLSADQDLSHGAGHFSPERSAPPL